MKIFHVITVLFTLTISAASAIPSSYTLSSFEKRDAPSALDPTPVKVGASRPPDPWERDGGPHHLFKAFNYRAPWIGWTRANEFLFKTIISILNSIIEDPDIVWAGGWEFSGTLQDIRLRIEDHHEELESQELSDLLDFMVDFIVAWQEYGWVPTFDISFKTDLVDDPENEYIGRFAVQNQHVTQKA